MIFQADTIIKEIITLGIEDIRKNLWLLDYILDDFTTIPYLQQKYGQKQIDACKEWFLQNNIDVYMQYTKDKERFPCVTVTLGSSDEKEEMKHMSDSSTETVTLMPNQIGKPIPFVIKPFIPTSFNLSTGIISVDPSVNLTLISVGMILVNPSTGQGTPILGIVTDGIQIGPNIDLNAAQVAVIPQFQFYTARIEHSFFQESYQIACHANDPQTLLWLHAIALFSLLRYREGLLEHNGFTQSVISSADMFLNDYYSQVGGEEIFTRTIRLSGQVENRWIKTPKRTIENVQMKEKFGDGSMAGGIKILGNLDPPVFIDTAEETWYVDQDPGQDSDEEDSGE